ncbi:hypothetical protein CsSME_00017836 [Camellia sinensis var. sinensis]
MNSTLMSQYIKFVADRLLVSLVCKRKYNVENPFDWMEFISTEALSSDFISMRRNILRILDFRRCFFGA